MSAKNWGICPRCHAAMVAAQKELKEKLKSAYGKVGEQEYLELQQRAKLSPKLGESMREDWELGIEPDGTFAIRYYATCEKCGFKHQFILTEKLKVDKK